MAASRKLYERIAWDARQLLAANPDGPKGDTSPQAHYKDGVHDGIEIAIVNLTDALYADNNNFNRDKFLRAAGIRP